MLLKKSLASTASALVLSLSLSNCANVGNAENICGNIETVVCVGGVVVTGLLIAWALGAFGDDNSYSPGDPGYNPSMSSDARLKRDISPAGALPNGVKLYTFRYWNDDRLFLGVVAQDLLKDERFKDAVSVSDNGYYLVNYRAIGATIGGDVNQFQEASRNALNKATPHS